MNKFRVFPLPSPPKKNFFIFIIHFIHFREIWATYNITVTPLPEGLVSLESAPGMYNGGTNEVASEKNGE